MVPLAAMMVGMNNHVPLSILFVALVVAVVPLAVALYLHGHMDVAAVLRNAAA